MVAPRRTSAELLAALESALAGRYRIREPLGHGGMATVFLADDLKHGRRVAIKVLEPEIAEGIGPERFRREIDLLASFAHPNILPLHDSGDANGALYYVMPYIEGESLRDRLRREGPLPFPDALQIAAEAAEALAYAHSRGVVHRDIKPGNILLSGGHAVVADFGIARSPTRHPDEPITQEGLAIGTPEYMSPEQGSGSDPVDARSDIYALGCVLFEMLAGEPPFTGNTAQAVLARHRQERIPSVVVVRPSLPPETDRLLAKALAKAPADRFASANQFRAALAELEHGAATRPPRPWWIVPAAGLVALLALSGWWLYSTRAPQGPAEALSAADPTHIAVLYFEDRSADSSLGPIAAGLTEDLINRLNDANALNVISALGVRPFRGHTVSLDSIQRSLGVSTVVSGSVSRAGELIRVSVQMVDASSKRQLFGQTVERPRSDFLSLRDQITDSLAWTLRTRLGQAVRLQQTRGETSNQAAWELVQQATELRQDAWALDLQGRTPDASELLWRADSLLGRAQALDSRWIRPLLARASVAADQRRFMRRNAQAPGRPALSGADWITRGLGFVQSALALHPNDAEALQLRGMLRFVYYKFEVDRPDSLPVAEADLRAAVEARPSLAAGWYWLSTLLNLTGRFEEAEQTAERAWDADPFNQQAEGMIRGRFYSALDREQYAEAQRWCNIAIQRFIQVQDVGDCALRILGWSGRGAPAIRQAASWLGRMEVIDSVHRYDVYWAERRILYAAVLARSGLTDSAQRTVDNTMKALPPSMAPLDRSFLDSPRAYVRLLSGERAEALRLLGKFLTTHPAEREYVAQSAWFRPLHDDPGFRAIVAPVP